jgi:hypothetical protein
MHKRSGRAESTSVAQFTYDLPVAGLDCFAPKWNSHVRSPQLLTSLERQREKNVREKNAANVSLFITRITTNFPGSVDIIQFGADFLHFDSGPIGECEKVGTVPNVSNMLINNRIKCRFCWCMWIAYCGLMCLCWVTTWCLWRSSPTVWSYVQKMARAVGSARHKNNV